MKIDVSVIIVSWNVRQLLDRCLASLDASRKEVHMEIIVVDNASSDDTVEQVRYRYPWVKVLALESNLGYARACNQGAAQATGRHLFFLNPDTEVRSTVLTRLTGWLDAHPSYAIAAPRIVNSDGSFQKGSVRRDPSVTSQFIVMLKMQRFLSWLPPVRRYLFRDFDPESGQDVPQVMGAALCIRADRFRKLGGFDERFFLWFEEVDLCTRVRAAGFGIRFVSDATVTHRGGASFKKTGIFRKQLIYNRSALQYFGKHRGRMSVFVLALTVPWNLFGALVLQLIGYGRS